MEWTSKLRAPQNLDIIYQVEREKLVKDWKDRLTVQYADYEDAVTVYSLVMGFIMDSIKDCSEKSPPNLQEGIHTIILSELGLEYIDYFDLLAGSVWEKFDTARQQGDMEMRSEILDAIAILSAVEWPDMDNDFKVLVFSFVQNYYEPHRFEPAQQKKIEEVSMKLQTEQTNLLRKQLEEEDRQNFVGNPEDFGEHGNLNFNPYGNSVFSSDPMSEEKKEAFEDAALPLYEDEMRKLMQQNKQNGFHKPASEPFIGEWNPEESQVDANAPRPVNPSANSRLYDDERKEPLEEIKEEEFEETKEPLDDGPAPIPPPAVPDSPDADSAAPETAVPEIDISADQKDASDDPNQNKSQPENEAEEEIEKAAVDTQNDNTKQDVKPLVEPVDDNKMSAAASLS